MLGDGQYINIAAKAPRPNAGKAFIDFFLDEESMKIQADTGEFVNRKGVYPPLPTPTRSSSCRCTSSPKKTSKPRRKSTRKFSCSEFNHGLRNRDISSTKISQIAAL